MALLSRKKKTETKISKTDAPTSKPAFSAMEFSDVILRPRVTEKASSKSMNENVYVFEVSKGADKISVAKAISRMYKVNPIKVAMIKIPAKKVFARGRIGVRPSGKKAYVYLKKGDKIEIV